jgi:hypothetical protein
VISENEVKTMMDHKNTCPLCGDALIYDGGYIQCQDPACGWNKPIYLDTFNSNSNRDAVRVNVNRDLVFKGKVPEITVVRNYKLCLLFNSRKIAI